MERAWELFESSGFGERDSDPAALSVQGRLLKDRARLAEGAARADLFAQAAQAYGAAHGLEPAPYLALNLATTRLLAGDQAGAQAAAAEVLALLDAPQPPADTPYYLAATRAEALLLLGDMPGAQAAMAEAARRDPDGWDDRAITLGQMAEVHAALGLDPTWLDAFRPPATLHFAGHMALESGGAGEAALAAQIDHLLAKRGIGLGCGTIAAGCDIIIAERVLARGGALHLFLPSPPDVFEAQSVAPAGTAWSQRFRSLLTHAEALFIASDGPPGGKNALLHDPLATHLAGEMAIGSALVSARLRATQGWQIVVLDTEGGGPSSRALADAWPDPGTALRLTLPRETDVQIQFVGDLDDPARCLATLVEIALDDPACTPEEWAQQAGPVWQVLAGVPAARISVRATGWQVLIDDPAAAADMIQNLLGLCRKANAPAPAIGAAYGLISTVADPNAPAVVPLGKTVRLAQRLARMAQGGTALLSEPLALALAARGPQSPRCEWFHDGEGDALGGVYALAISGSSRPAGAAQQGAGHPPPAR